MKDNITIPDPPLARLFFSNTKTSVLWLIVRFYVGYVWLHAGIEKITNEVWFGAKAGTAISGFVKAALAKTDGAHPDVQGWYAWFLDTLVLPYAEFWSYIVVYGEILVGIALLLGAFTGIAAFFGAFMNFNFLLAGALSTNPILFLLSIGLVLAWKTAGFIGLDYYLLPLLGTPWSAGKVFRDSK